MATNDFLTFASNSGANVISQANYLSLAAQATGFQSGIAQSAQLNKVWRQSSIISAMIAQFICDKSGQSAIDDGTITTLETNFMTALQSVGRIRLTSALNMYISPSGSDSNSGLNVGTPLLTIQKAYIILQTNYDLNGRQVQINLANGTYSSGLSAAFPLVGQTSAILITGNVASPASVVVNSSTQQVNTFTAFAGANIQLQGMTLTSSGTGQGGYCLVANAGGRLEYGNVVFSNASGGHVAAVYNGILACFSGYTINGSAPNHINASWGGNVSASGSSSSSVISLIGTPNFSTAFVVATGGVVVAFTNMSFSGNATGQRYIAANSATISVNGAGVNYFPGSVAGTSTNGYYS